MNIYDTEVELPVLTQEYQNVLAFGKNKQRWEIIGLEKFIDYKVCWSHWMYLPMNPTTQKVQYDKSI